MVNRHQIILLTLINNFVLVFSSKLPQDPNRLRHPLSFDWTASCDECDSEMCEEIPSNCSSGIIRDACDCCYVCGNLEGTSCDLPESLFRFGQCGKGLVCIPPPSAHANPDMSAKGYCACESSTVLCGNDGRTYANSCRFERALARNQSLSLLHEGPCNAAPLVDIPPMNQTAESGSSAVFSCTVSGYPFAWFEWFKDGVNVFQPDLSHDLTVQIRSGPLKYQITSWLEIKRSHPNHSGFYTCVATNALGEANATAMLEVIDDDMDVTNFYVFRGKHYQFTNDKRIYEQENVRKILYARGRQSSDSIDSSRENFEDSTNQKNDELQEDLQNQENSASSDNVGDVLVETLEELVEPKEFKDVFFDDLDFSEGSTNENELKIH